MPQYSIKFLPLGLLLSLGLCVLNGCSGSDVEMGQVSGQVTLEGEPVADLFVIFHPRVKDGGINAPTRQALGETDAEGIYSLSTKTPGDGAAVGKHQVELAPIQQGSPVPGKLAPGFEAEVQAGENTIDLVLLPKK
ncbi:MAG: hypothetical protein RH917_16290 [Lacipirellulaceae bacterium]